MAEADPYRCTPAALARGDEMHGTASRVRRWLVLEQAGPWGRDAVRESRLEADVADELGAAASQSGVRVLIVRRPGWRSDADGPRRVYLAHSAPQASWLEQVDIDDPRQLVDLDLRALTAPEAPGFGSPGPAAVHLVCTNGRHDPCCADFGRPVVRALDDAGLPEVWESSHVGGDRFAANLVCLPTGVYFGRLDPDGAPALVADFDRGVLDLDHYRGRSCYPPLVQSAEVFARHVLDERRVDGITVVRAEGDSGRLTAVLAAVDGRSVEVDVVREKAEAVLLTCTSSSPGAPWRYRLVDVRTA